MRNDYRAAPARAADAQVKAQSNIFVNTFSSARYALLSARNEKLYTNGGIRYNIKTTAPCIIMVILLYGILSVLAGCAPESPSAGEPLAVHYFYMNVCASCNEHEVFLQHFETITGIARNTPNLEIHTYNVYESYEMSVYRKMATELGWDADTPAFPILVVGDKLYNSSEIDSYLTGEGFSESIPHPELTIPPGASAALFFYVPGCADCEKAEKIIDALPELITIGARAGVGGDGVSASGVSGGDSAGGGNSGASMGGVGGNAGGNAGSSADAGNAAGGGTDDGNAAGGVGSSGEAGSGNAAGARESPVHILRVSASDNWGISLFRTYCEEYSIPPEKQKVPAVFVGYKALMSVDEIGGLEAILRAGDGRNTPLMKAESGLGILPINDISSGGQAGQGSKGDQNGQGGQYISAPSTPLSPGGYSFLGALLTGFVNGLNPCSISMLLMLLSLLAAKDKWIIPIGITFLLGKFTGFLLLGTVLYNSLNSLHLTGFRFAINIALVAFASIMIILNINDVLAAVRNDYGKIKLQLPKKLRGLNHEIIKRTAALDSAFALAAGAAVLGIVVSASEFLCTGQIYVAMIISTINAGTGVSGAAFGLLALYSVAFVAPPAILILLIGRGRRIFTVSEFFRSNLMWIKLINIAVFVLVIVLVFIL